MNRTYSSLCIMRHYGLGLREGMALSVIHQFGMATSANIAGIMKIRTKDANLLAQRLKWKGMVNTGHKLPRKKNGCWAVWVIKPEVKKVMDSLEATGRIPDEMTLNNPIQ